MRLLLLFAEIERDKPLYSLPGVRFDVALTLASCHRLESSLGYQAYAAKRLPLYILCTFQDGRHPLPRACKKPLAAFRKGT